MLPRGCKEQAEIRRIIERTRQKVEMIKENGVFQIEAWIDSEKSEASGIPFAK